jgi:N-acetyl-anhydromuramoyl-L-alanine amidase
LVAIEQRSGRAQRGRRRREIRQGIPELPVFAIDARDGWLEGVRRVESPNCDQRPAGMLPELIVIHGISLPPGKFGGPWIDRLFTNSLPAERHAYFATIADLRVSAHVVIGRNGRLTQYVPFQMRAWHAGTSCHRGRAACNDFSIGIELEGSDDSPYEDAQYAALAALVLSLRQTYASLHSADIVGHCDIAPGRKTDPGPSFEWSRLKRMLAPPPVEDR